MISLITKVKFVLGIAAVSVIAFYIWSIKSHSADLEKLNSELVEKNAAHKATIQTLKYSVTELNDQVAKSEQEIARREVLATKSIEYSNSLSKKLSNQREQLKKLKSQNEEFKIWAANSVPLDAIKLLDNARARGSGKNESDKPLSSIDSTHPL